MSIIKDFRQDAIHLAARTNAKAKLAGLEKPVDLHVDEFVHLHCGNELFIVFRDIVVAGSMYFECALFGFYKETYDQEIFFVDIDPAALHFYLNIAHAWFFGIKVRGTRPVLADGFKEEIEAIEEQLMQDTHIPIPKLKLSVVAQAVILADRFVHRPLLTLLRRLFINLLNFTHTCWVALMVEERKWETEHHQEFMLDYLDAFDLLSTGHDDEKMLRDALTESFYWFSLDNDSFIELYKPIMSEQFIAEWTFDRNTSETTRFTSHAMGIFFTDQMMYAAKTRQHKGRRFKRVMNLCSPEMRDELLPWFDAPDEKRARNYRLTQIAEARRLERVCEANFVPGASTHGGSPCSAATETSANVISADEQSTKKQLPQKKRKNFRSRGGPKSRGGQQQQQDRHVHDNGDYSSGRPPTSSEQLQANANIAATSQLTAAFDLVDVKNITGHVIEQMTETSHQPQAQCSIQQDEKRGPKNKKAQRKRNKKNKTKQQEVAADGLHADSHGQMVVPTNVDSTSYWNSYRSVTANYDAEFPPLGAIRGDNDGRRANHNQLLGLDSALDLAPDHQVAPLGARDPYILTRRGRNGCRGGGGAQGRGAWCDVS